MSTKTTILTDALYPYFLDVSLREPEILKTLRLETAKLSTANMQIAPEQGQFMRLLMELIGAKRTLEIGVYTGYSALSVALALPDEGEIIACDVNEEWTAMAEKYWEKAGVSHKIKLRLAPALETLERLIATGEGGTFDFAFIDADKNNYEAYYEKCLTLIRQGGLMAIDNTLWHGRVADPQNHDASTETLRRLNRKILADERVSMSLLPLGDGLTLIRKRFL